MSKIIGRGSLNTLLHACILVEHIFHGLCCFTLYHGNYACTGWFFKGITRGVCLTRDKIFRGLIKWAEVRVAIPVYSLGDKCCTVCILFLALDFEEISWLADRCWRTIYGIVCFVLNFFWSALIFLTTSCRVIKKLLIAHGLAIRDEIVHFTWTALVLVCARSFVIFTHFVCRIRRLQLHLRRVLRLLGSLILKLICFLYDRHRTTKSHPLSRWHLFAQYDWGILFSLLIGMLIWILCDWLWLGLRWVTQQATLIFFVSIWVIRFLMLFDIEVVYELSVLVRIVLSRHRIILITDKSLRFL